MRTLLALVTVCVLMCSTALAQEKLQVEIGTAFGVTMSIPDDGDAEFFVGIPGAGTFIGLPSLYATFLPTPKVMVEPQVYFLYTTIAEEALISAVLQLGYLLTPEAKGSPYIAIHGGGFFVTEEGASNSGEIGAAFGYRIKVTTGAAFRVELLYRRWLAEFWELNDVSLRFGIGAVF